MEKLRESVIKLASSDLNAPLSSSQIALIDQRLHESFPLGLRAPSHPTYATMVLKAIEELNEEDGSSEDSISEYIKADNDDLPWAHKSILSHHLKKLCDDGVIVLTASNRYSVPDFTPKRVLKKGKSKRKHVRVYQRVSCQKKSEDLSSCGKEGHELVSERKLPKLVCEENQDILGSVSHDGIEDELVKNECRSLVVVEDEEELKLKGQEDKKSEMVEGDELEKQDSLIPKLSIPDMVKIYRRKTQRKCDQVLTEETGSLAAEDVSSGDEWMNNGASFENLVKKKKKDAVYPIDRDIVCAIAKQLPKPFESGQCVTRQLNNSEQQPKELISSPVSKHDDLQEALILCSQDNPVNRDIVFAIAKQLPKTASGRRVTRQFSNSKQQTKELILSPDSKSPNPKLRKNDNLQEALNLSSQETKSNWPSWIPSLLQTDFNGQCKVHANAEKSVCNLYCSDCKNGALCSSCVASHEGHHVIMIEQADFEQLVDVSHIGMLDVSGIRTIKESSTKNFIVLKRELTSWHYVPWKFSCLFCKSRVPFPFEFCTLSCKFQHELKVG